MYAVPFVSCLLCVLLGLAPHITNRVVWRRKVAAVLVSEHVKFCHKTGTLAQVGIMFFAADDQHTLNHVACPACEKAKNEAMGPDTGRELPFRQGATLWMQDKALYVQERTKHDYTQYLKPLNEFFGAMPLNTIHIGNIREYQKWRRENGVGNLRINHEVGCLGQILNDVPRTWLRIKPYYKKLPVNHVGPGRAITQEHADCIVQIARSSEKRTVALYASLLMIHTVAGPGEVRHLRIRDIDLTERRVHYHRGVKNRFRVRTQPLNDTAANAVRKLMERAKERGSYLPDHYLLPAKADKGGHVFNPDKPQGGWYRAWRSIISEATKKHPELKGLRPYDCRHTGATWLCEHEEVSEHITRKLAGWRVDSPMIDRYSHVREDRKRQAVEAIDPAKPKAVTPLTSTLTFLWKFGK